MRSTKQVSAKSEKEVNGQLALSFVSAKVVDAEDAGKTYKIKISEPLSLLTSTVSLSFLERRIFWIVLRELKRIQVMDRDKIKPYSHIDFEFHYSEVMPGHNNSDVHKLRHKLLKRVIDWYDPIEQIEKSATVFNYAEYRVRSGIIQLTMSYQVIPLFLDLSKGYSSFLLEHALSLTSEYAQLLYPHVARWQRTGSWRVSLADFRKHMNIPDDKYHNFHDIQRRVIDMALTQMNKFTDLTVSCKTFKSGNAVSMLEFVIKPKKDETKEEFQEKKNMLQEEIDYALGLDLAELITQVDATLRERYPSFTAEQRRIILTDPEAIKRFVRAEIYADNGFATIDYQAYVAQSVFGYKKSTSKPK